MCERKNIMKQQVKNIMINYIKMEAAKKRKLQKVDYLMKHAHLLEKGMLDEIGCQKTLLCATKEILVSNRALKSCPSYPLLEQYFSQYNRLDSIDKNQAGIELLKILSNMTNVMGRVQETDQIDKITSYYSYISLNDQLQQNETQKRISYSA